MSDKNKVKKDNHKLKTTLKMKTTTKMKTTSEMKKTSQRKTTSKMKRTSKLNTTSNIKDVHKKENKSFVGLGSCDNVQTERSIFKYANCKICQRVPFPQAM